MVATKMVQIKIIAVVIITVFCSCRDEQPKSASNNIQSGCSFYLSKADEFRVKNLPLEEINYLEQAKKNNCSSSRLHINLGDSYFKTDQVEKAVQEFETAKGFREDLPLIYSNLGMCYSILGDNGQATNHFLKAIESEPQNADHYYYLGTHQQMNNNLKGALLNLDKAIAINPTNPVFHTKRAAIWGNHGEYLKAISDVNKALSFKPTPDVRSDILWIKTMCFIELNQLDSACSNLTELKRSDPTSDYSEIELECN